MIYGMTSHDNHGSFATIYARADVRTSGNPGKKSSLYLYWWKGSLLIKSPVGWFNYLSIIQHAKNISYWILNVFQCRKLLLEKRHFLASNNNIPWGMSSGLSSGPRAFVRSINLLFVCNPCQSEPHAPAFERFHILLSICHHYFEIIVFFQTYTWNFSLLSSAKQQSEMTKKKRCWRTWTKTANFINFYFEFNFFFSIFSFFSVLTVINKVNVLRE